MGAAYKGWRGQREEPCSGRLMVGNGRRGRASQLMWDGLRFGAVNGRQRRAEPSPDPSPGGRGIRAEDFSIPAPGVTGRSLWLFARSAMGAGVSGHCGKMPCAPALRRQVTAGDDFVRPVAGNSWRVWTLTCRPAARTVPTVSADCSEIWAEKKRQAAQHQAITRDAQVNRWRGVP